MRVTRVRFGGLAGRSSGSHAIQDNWLGGTGNWGNCPDWSLGCPGPANDVLIYSGGNDNVTLDVGTTAINSLTLGGLANGFASQLTDSGNRRRSPSQMRSTSVRTGHSPSRAEVPLLRAR